MKDYYKKIDKSLFKYGISITKEYIESFCAGLPIEKGKSREVNLHFKGVAYKGKLWHMNRKAASSIYHLRWDNNSELQNELKEEFIQSYIAIESENYKAKSKNKYYVTDLLGGNQEVLIFKPKDIGNIELETFIKIETPYDELFKRLVRNNVFGWMSKDNYMNMISKSTKWIDLSDLPKHMDESYVVYYLIDDVAKEIYIGSAIRLGDRVKIGRSEIPGWNKFRYEILHPSAHAYLRDIEYHAIMNFASFFENNGNLNTLGISEYRLVNRDYKYYLK